MTSSHTGMCRNLCSVCVDSTVNLCLNRVCTHPEYTLLQSCVCFLAGQAAAERFVVFQVHMLKRCVHPCKLQWLFGFALCCTHTSRFYYIIMECTMSGNALTSRLWCVGICLTGKILLA